MCSTGKLSLYPPPGQVIPRNARILIEVPQAWRASIRQLIAANPMLVSGGDRVPLRSLAEYPGIKVLEIVLGPERALKPNEKYHFEADFKQLDPKTATFLRALSWSWTTSDAIDRSAPRWKEAPTLTGTSADDPGCGPHRMAGVKTLTEDDGAPPLILVELQGEGEPASRFLLRSGGKGIWIGRSMCGGAFALVDGARYRATLTAVDLAGNETPAPGPPILFQGPRPEPDLFEEDRAPKRSAAHIAGGAMTFAVAFALVLVIRRRRAKGAEVARSLRNDLPDSDPYRGLLGELYARRAALESELESVTRGLGDFASQQAVLADKAKALSKDLDRVRRDIASAERKPR